MGETRPKGASYEDLCRLPEDVIGEIIGGDLVASPRPSSAHAMAATVIGSDLGNAFHRSTGGTGGPGGWWIVFEPEIHLGEDVLVPDIAGWRRSRLPVFPDVPAIELAPDWVCEVISPSTARIDRVRKMPIYARENVSHVWLVDPRLRTVEVYQLESHRWVVVGSYAEDDRVRIEPFDEAEIDLARWWANR